MARNNILDITSEFWRVSVAYEGKMVEKMARLNIDTYYCYEGCGAWDMGYLECNV